MENKKKHFSVLMSVYAKENPEHLRQALESNLKQTVVPDELVLVCDGPLTDELDKVIADFKTIYPEHLQIYRLQENRGLGEALNYGLEKCRYDWVARSDSDDICAPDRFEILMDYVNTHPNIDILGSYIDEFNSDYQNPVHKKQLPLEHDAIVELAKFRNPMNHMAVMFKKETIEKIGSYQHLPYVEDYYLWIRAIQSGAKLANVDQYLVHARIGNGMMKRRSNIEYIKSWKRLNQYMVEHKMISVVTQQRNMLAVRAFIYMPVKMKELVYKYILRKKD